MKTIYYTAILSFSLLVNLIAQTQSNKIAILDLKAVGVSEKESTTLSDHLRSELVGSNTFTVLERNEMETMLARKGLRQTSCTTDECAVEIGRLLKMNLICSGSVGKLGSMYLISVRMIDVQTGRILLTVDEECQCSLQKVLSTSIEKIAAKLAEQGRILMGEGSKKDQARLVKPASLRLTSVPTNSTITIHGQKMGKTPFTAKDLSLEMVYVEVSYPGYETERRYVSLEDAVLSNEHFVLKKLPPLQVNSDPSDALVYVNEEFIGKTPLTIEEVAEEILTIVIKKEYYNDWESELILETLGDEKIIAQLVPMKGTLNITSHPDGVYLAINKKVVGNTPYVGELPYGEYDIRLGSKEYGLVKEKVILNQPRLEKNYDMETRLSEVIFSNLDQNAFVLVDNRAMRPEDGKLRLSVGEHKIKVIRSGYESKFSTVMVKAKNDNYYYAGLKRKTKSKAFLRSLFVPGLGQSYQEKNMRKWLYPALFVGTAAASYAMLNSYNTTVDDYNGIKEQYETAFSINDINSYREQMFSAYDDVESDAQARNIMFVAVGAVWLWNVVDALVLPSGYKSNLALTSKSGNQQLKFGIAINW